MRRITNVRINDRVYNCVVSDTQETRLQGLKNIRDLPNDMGMIFIHEKEGFHPYWMADTKIPLTLIFANKNNNIIDVKHREDTDSLKNARPTQPAKFVIEVNLDRHLSDFIGEKINIGEVSNVQ